MRYAALTIFLLLALVLLVTMMLAAQDTWIYWGPVV